MQARVNQINLFLVTNYKKGKRYSENQNKTKHNNNKVPRKIKLLMFVFLLCIFVTHYFQLFSSMLLSKGVSPGVVRTEFRYRMYKMDDLEEALKSYDKSVDGVSYYEVIL